MNTKRPGTLAIPARRTAAAWITAFTIITPTCNAIAQESSATSPMEHEAATLQLAEIERLFWLCDYVATTRGVDAAPVDACSAATEELKNAKFGGDFMVLLAWWQGKKPEEHARVAQRLGPVERTAIDKRDRSS
jgi:hypothetical protein